jgi:hypothetical protein
LPLSERALLKPPDLILLQAQQDDPVNEPGCRLVRRLRYLNPSQNSYGDNSSLSSTARNPREGGLRQKNQRREEVEFAPSSITTQFHKKEILEL